MRALRLVVVAALAATIVATATQPVAGHVTVQPPEATKGGFAKVAFRTPNERDDAGTVKLEVAFPEDTPLFNVSTRPLAGWRATVERRELATPVEVFGEPRTDAVARVVWEGGTIAPGQFEDFEVSVGPLPDDADELVFKALQTYSSGEVVRWIEEAEGGAAEEPEHPAPVLRLVAADGATDDAAQEAATTEPDDDDGTDVVSIVALALGALATLLGVIALGRSRGRVDRGPTKV